MNWITVAFILVSSSVLCSESIEFLKKFQQKIDDWTKYKRHDGKTWPPDFCRKYECPKFTVLDDKNAYQLREYEPSTWVGTSISGVSYQFATRKMFWKLFYYLNKNNDKNQSIKMTVPVITSFLPDQEGRPVNNYTMYFFLSLPDPPNPTDSDVKIFTYPKQRMFVRSFPGYIMKRKTWAQEAEKLKVDINDTLAYDTTQWFTAGYNSPFEFVKRHNEILFVAK